MTGHSFKCKGNGEGLAVKVRSIGQSRYFWPVAMGETTDEPLAPLANRPIVASTSPLRDKHVPFESLSILCTAILNSCCLCEDGSPPRHVSSISRQGHCRLRLMRKQFRLGLKI